MEVDRSRLPKIEYLDQVLVTAHHLDAGLNAEGERAIIYRPTGRYVVLFVFKSGNIFARWIDGGGCDPQVIQPKFIAGKIETGHKKKKAA